MKSVFCADCANGKKGAPPKAEKLVGSHLEEIRKAILRHSGHPLVLVGKSMGSRYFRIGWCSSKNGKYIISSEIQRLSLSSYCGWFRV